MDQNLNGQNSALFNGAWNSQQQSHKAHCQLKT